MGCKGYLVGLHRLSGGLHRLSGWVAQAIWCKTDNSAISDQTELGFGWVCLSLAIFIKIKCSSHLVQIKATFQFLVFS